MRPGDHACPPTFPERHRVGVSAAVECPACSCKISARSCTMRLFNADNCTGSAIDIPLDNVCRESGASGSYGSYRVNGAATCALDAANAAAVSVASTNAQTLCCR